jgi:HlyD family secretion protein
LRFKPTDTGASSGGSGIAGALVPRPRRRGGAGSGKGETVKRGGAQTVYVLAADGTPKPVDITTGESNGSMTEVLGGALKPGDKVITGQLAKDATGGASGQRRRSGGQGGGQ